MGPACRALHISRASYYQWRSGTAGGRVAENQRIAQLVQEIHRESPNKGYRRIRDDLDKYYHTPVNDKRTLRICRGLGIQSVVKHAPHGCTRAASSPRQLAENVLDRQFYADRPNEKWLTDVTEFHYYTGTNMRKLYLSAILDLCDRRIVSFVIRTPTTLPWSIALWLRHWRAIPAPALCSTATGAAPIPLRSSMTSWLQLALHRVCPGWESALTTAPWRASGASSSGSATMAGGSPAGSSWSR